MKTINEKWDKGQLISRTESDDGIPEPAAPFADKSVQVNKKWWEFWK